jgi:hypothetical protein
MKRLIEKTVVLWIGDGLALCNLTHQTLAVLREADDRRGRAPAFLIHDDQRLSAFHRRHTELVVPRSIPMTLLIRSPVTQS